MPNISNAAAATVPTHSRENCLRVIENYISEVVGHLDDIIALDQSIAPKLSADKLGDLTHYRDNLKDIMADLESLFRPNSLLPLTDTDKSTTLRLMSALQDGLNKAEKTIADNNASGQDNSTDKQGWVSDFAESLSAYDKHISAAKDFKSGNDLVRSCQNSIYALSSEI